MRQLLASTGLGTLAIVLASSAAAETVISTATTTPVTTSAAGDIRITSTGSIKPTSGVAVTVNSSNSVKNEGTIAIQGANDSAGIVANPGFTGNISNSGIITIDENYTPTDTDKDGDVDGPFAQGSNRYGIHVLGGGTYTGDVTHNGTIAIEGNGSAGIAIDSALNGSVNLTNGKVGVTGNDSVGLRTGAVSGNVIVGSGSTIQVQGQNSVGVLVGGDVGGSLVLQGTVTSTGYRYAVSPFDPSKLDADDLLQGGPAVLVSGNVAGGILLDTRPAENDANNADEDGDGIPDASETTASIASFGAAPALKIGSTTQDIAIGAVASSSAGHGLVIRGNVGASGVYSGINATALEIGGTGHAVNIAGGMTLTGNVAATAIGANATAIHLGAGASVPQITISGSVNSTGGGSSTAASRAILIDSGATVSSITNSGTILATRNGTSGTAAAIVDRSGTLALVQNSGSIGVPGNSALEDWATAIDVSQNTSGAVVRQVAAATGKPAPSIAGSILFGSGADTLDIQAGSVTGKVDFGGGSDSMSLSGSSTFRGTLLNSGGLALNIGAGTTLQLQNAGAVNLASLTTGAGASLGVHIGDSGFTSFNVAGTASFATGTKLIVTFDQIGTAAGNYAIVDAGTLVGAGNLTSSTVSLPYLFNSTLTSDSTTVTLGVQRKSASELGLNRSESAIIDAALVAADADSGVAGVILSISDSETLKSTLQQMMPEHAGGVFETVTKPSRLAADILAQPSITKGLWMQQVAWGSSKSVGDTSSYKLGSWGAVGGYDVPVGKLGSVGVSLGYYFGKDQHSAAELVSDHYEAGVYWRGVFGPFRAWARGTAATINFDGTRRFSGLDGLNAVNRSADARWKGRLYSGSAGVAYEARAGRLSIRPNASIEYYKLHENGYTESGGGNAYDLTVRDRDSNETAANALVAVGYDFMRRDDEDSGWLRLELEGGRRQILSGSVGDTVASFGSGTPFTLTADERTSGWRGGLRLLGGGSSMSFFAEANAEQQQGQTALGGRIGASFGF
jgi:hypothetical protein